MCREQCTAHTADAHLCANNKGFEVPYATVLVRFGSHIGTEERLEQLRFAPELRPIAPHLAKDRMPILTRVIRLDPQRGVFRGPYSRRSAAAVGAFLFVGRLA